YRFELLAAGLYSVTVEMAGFQTITQNSIGVAVSNVTTANFTLQPGRQTEVITVGGLAVTLVDTQKTDVGLSVTGSLIQSLPLNGRYIANLAYLAPGAKPVNSYDPTKNRMAIFGINGSAGRNVNITVNGIDNKDNT